MNAVRIITVAAIVLVAAGSQPSASGPVGFYGIVERVVFEPNAAAPERVQVWGVFAYADLGILSEGGNAGASRTERGYLYFTLPAVSTTNNSATPAALELVRREWADLAAVAGTGQAVAFGRWGYFGRFGDLEPDQKAVASGDRLGYVPGGTLYVRPPSDPPASPAVYSTNAGIVRLSDQGSHASIVAQLREHRGRPAPSVVGSKRNVDR